MAGQFSVGGSSSDSIGGDLGLVLSGGGARAAYQVGVLAAIAERIPDLKVPIHAGVSAGAINTITLASHPGSFGAAVRTLRGEWARLSVDQVYQVRMTGLAAATLRWLVQRVIPIRRSHTIVRGVFDMNPLRLFLGKRVNIRQIATNIQNGKVRAISLSATCYGTGETVTFVQGAEDLEMWQRSGRRSVRTNLSLEHVMASAAIPILFPAVELDGAYYGDGSVRQAAPLAPAIHIGAERILAVSMRSMVNSPLEACTTISYPSAAQVMGMLFHSVFLDALDADAERLERINSLLDSRTQLNHAGKEVRPVKLLVLRPSLDLGAMARPHWKRLPPVMRSLVQSIGGQREGASDFISYLLFDPAYTMPLIELGYDDTNDQWWKLEQFFED
ncbi:MAG: patatin-like phospholipase family protein [Gemmatimonadota bacterium]|nr:patatin-like phospholipase family protein [Gemmatimonadota bacterium]MDH5804526.1 patatin-like phospholipase family protein [Gemmatimonadota bacterium]